MKSYKKFLLWIKRAPIGDKSFIRGDGNDTQKRYVHYGRTPVISSWAPPRPSRARRGVPSERGEGPGRKCAAVSPFPPSAHTKQQVVSTPCGARFWNGFYFGIGKKKKKKKKKEYPRKSVHGGARGSTSVGRGRRLNHLNNGQIVDAAGSLAN